MLLVTHNQWLLDYVTSDRVHVLADGRIVRLERAKLAHELERESDPGAGAGSVAAC